MGYFSKNSGLIGTGQNKRVGVHDIISSKLNNSGSFFSSGENLIFTTSRMVGPIGPSKQMTDAFYGDYYTAGVMDLFDTQPYNGIQRFNVPASGDYRFYMMGAYAGGNRYQGYSNSDIFDTTLAISNEQAITSSTNLNYTFGCPGLLVCDITLTEGDVLDILVGQSGNQSFFSNRFSVAGSGGGASAVWVGGHGSSTWAIAGGGGSDRDAGTGYNNGKGNAPYSTTGGSGGSGLGGTNGAGGASSDNHGAAGAGLTGNGSSHNDNRGNFYALSPYAHALGGSGWGRGAASAAQYCDPWDGTDSGGIYCYIDPTTYKVTQTGIFRTGLDNSDEATFTSYYNGTANTISGYIPSNGAHGGFGGGAAGNWGGAGGAGGYSGGGGGGNGTAGGGGSSYVSGFTYVSHTVYDKNTSYNSVRCPIQLVSGSISLSSSNVDIPTGVVKGDGFVVMERI